ncbi:hypothetical protein ACLB1Q_12275 [Escherichia coli]
MIIYGCGYMSKDYWRLGAIFGDLISMLLLVGWPIRDVELIRSPNAE